MALDDAAYQAALLSKLVEETHEASHAAAPTCPVRLANVIEVLYALMATADMSWARLLPLADDKRNRRGLQKAIFLESVQ